MRGQTEEDERNDAKLALELCKQGGIWVDAKTANTIMAKQIEKMSDAEKIYELQKLELEIIRSREFRPVKVTRICKRGELVCTGEVEK